MIQMSCRRTPAAEMRNPPPKQKAAATMARRGPPSSTQRPNTAADTPRKTIASVKIQPRSVSFQSPGAGLPTPMRRVIGRLNTLKAYACPMHKWTHSAAGGTIQRLKAGPATVRSRSRNESGRIPEVYLAAGRGRRGETRQPRLIDRASFAGRYDIVPLWSGRARPRAAGPPLGLNWLMPELPDVCVYREALEQRIVGRRLERVLLQSPFLLRTVDPPIESAQGQRVTEDRRIGKRLGLGLEGELWLVFHLMIAGRLHWFDAGAPPGKRAALARLQFDSGTLTLTEAGTKRRASLHLVQGEEALRRQDPGGLEVLGSTAAEFAARLRSGNHTLKRALTDPRLFSGIGNAYSDEILHAARLSPVMLTSRASDAELLRLHGAAREQLQLWTERLRRQSRGRFPEKVTAFRDEMAVHGRFRLPCPVCGTPVQRIRYADNETNYCAICQTGGRLLADRALSRLLKEDWPKTVDGFDRDE